MDTLIDQFDDESETRRKMEDSQRRSDDWLTTIITTMAGANGVGLLTLATYVPSQTLGKWLTLAASGATLGFAGGLTMASLTMLAKRRQLELIAMGYRTKLQSHHFKMHFAAHFGEEDASRFREALQGNSQLIGESEADARIKLTRWLGWSEFGFVIGFLLIIATMVGHATTSPSIKGDASCPTPEAATAAQSPSP